MKIDEKYKKDMFLASFFTLSLLTAFGFGYFTANIVSFEKPAITVEKADNDHSTEKTEVLQGSLRQDSGQAVVGSVNSDKYHYEHCPGAQRIKEENKVYFESADQAQEAGYTLAGNCK